MEDLSELLTPKDIMKHLHISNKKMYDLLKTRGFPTFRIGRSYYIPKKEYEEWIVKHAKTNANIIL